MIIGILPNTTKSEIADICRSLITKLNENGFDFLISSSIAKLDDKLNEEWGKDKFLDNSELCKKSDLLISLGGDGTMLNSAYVAYESGTPLVGVNLGKLGFLAEFDIHHMDRLIEAIKNDEYEIEERMVLQANCISEPDDQFVAFNDFVIDKGRWPKMIELTIKVDEEYVSTFSADGLIVATPTGSTGYSLSTGGPIVNPKSHVVTLSPISPHTLTMRPLVLSSDQEITIIADSHHTSIQINCDGQRVYNFKPPVNLQIKKSNIPLRLVHTKDKSYYEILRNKLFWGLDVRNTKNN
ncbi:NAD(+)/NADH kinase [Bacteroidota bacterium]